MGYFNSPSRFEKLVAQLAVEDCAEVLIQGLDRGFRQYEMPSRAYGYLAAHLLLENDEDGHSRWAIESLSREPELKDRLEEAHSIYESVYRAFCGVFDGVYRAWVVAGS
jgi:hypothetical protein